MKPKDTLKVLKPTFVINFFKSRAGLAVMAILIALTALAFNPDSVASAVGKLWRGAKPSPTKTRTAKPVAPKSTAPATTQRGATLATDKSGYLAGETVTVTGSGFSRGERVMLQVKHADGAAEPGMGHEVRIVTADGEGGFNAKWPVNAHDSTGNHFTLFAAGASGVTSQVSFNRVALVKAERTDYRPGETAIINGAGFQPGELVTIQVVRMNRFADIASFVPFNVTSDAGGNIGAFWAVPQDDLGGSVIRLPATGTAYGLEAVALLLAAPITSIDDQGPDDEPGQKDLNQLTVDYAGIPSSLSVFWN